MPTSRPMSPVRVVKNALRAASEFLLLLPPVPDQHERAEAHDLPAEQQLEGVLGHDQVQHAGREQAEEGEVVGEADVALHVLDREDVHEQRDDRDHDEQGHRQAVDVGADAERRCRPTATTSTTRMTGAHDGVGLLLGRGAAPTGRCCAMRPRAPSSCPASSTRWIHWRPCPMDSTKEAADGGDADLGALLRQALAEEEDERRTTPPG